MNLNTMIYIAAGAVVLSHAAWYAEWRQQYQAWKRENTLAVNQPSSYRGSMHQIVPTFADYQRARPLVHPMVKMWYHVRDWLLSGRGDVCFYTLIVPAAIVGLIAGILTYMFCS